jgi:hypothetical protein
MNKHVYFYNLQTGVFTGESLGGPSTWVDQSIPEGMGAWEGVLDYMSQKVDTETNTLVDYQPPKPEDTDLVSYVWDTETKRWVATTTLTAVKNQKKNLISTLRETKNLEPITYNNMLFDCDAQAQRNIQAWVTNINAGINPPQGFVWRDYNNVDQPADANFILGLNAAVVARGTQMYQTSWNKKAEVDALTTIEQVNSYDINAGW